VGREIRLLPPDPHISRGIEALPSHLILAVAGHDGADVHLSFRQGAGLVRADDRRGSERLHRGQLPDQGVPANHALEPEGEADRHNRGEAFRDRRDREADGRQEEELDVARV